MTIRRWCPLLLVGLLGVGALPPEAPAPAPAGPEPGPKKVYILPVRETIDRPLLYLVRRGVKEAMEARADLLVIDMDTDGGAVSTTEEIIRILNQFKGQTATYVNQKAFSAGAFISFATQKIYMAPQSVIGAAAPILITPGGGGPVDMPKTLEAKIASALSALVRANAEKNGHNPEVADAMVKMTKELVIDGHIINKAGEILTLTNREAEREYGDPPKPLLSAGTMETLEDVLKELGFADAVRVDIKPTGAEQLATWINAISPLLLIIGVIGIYIEFKTPGFGLPGIIGITAFAIYFLGSYVAGLSGMEWIAIFVLGLILVALELFVFPGTIFLGLIGALLMLLSVVMAMVDVYPGMPTLPSLPQLELPLRNLFIATVGAAIGIWLLSRWLPRTALFHSLVSEAASGVSSVRVREQRQTARIGQTGVALSNLHPGGKAQFGDEVIDVMTQGEMIDRGRPVRIIGHTAAEAVVEEVR